VEGNISGQTRRRGGRVPKGSLVAPKRDRQWETGGGEGGGEKGKPALHFKDPRGAGLTGEKGLAQREKQVGKPLHEELDVKGPTEHPRGDGAAK